MSHERIDIKKRTCFTFPVFGINRCFSISKRSVSKNECFGCWNFRIASSFNFKETENSYQYLCRTADCCRNIFLLFNKGKCEITEVLNGFLGFVSRKDAEEIAKNVMFLLYVFNCNFYIFYSRLSALCVKSFCGCVK